MPSSSLRVRQSQSRAPYDRSNLCPTAGGQGRAQVDAAVLHSLTHPAPHSTAALTPSPTFVHLNYIFHYVICTVHLNTLILTTLICILLLLYLVFASISIYPFLSPFFFFFK